MIPQVLPGRTPEEQVYLFWRARQKRPNLCKLTAPRKRLLRGALRDYEARDLCALVVYAYESDAKGPRFWREGDYLDLVNLLVGKNLAGRMEKAVDWHERQMANGGEEIDPVALMTALQSRKPGTRTSLGHVPVTPNAAEASQNLTEASAAHATTPVAPPKRRKRPTWG